MKMTTQKDWSDGFGGFDEMNTLHYITWPEYDKLMNDLAARIFVKRQSEQVHIDFITGIPKDGLIPAVHLSHLLNIPFIHDIHDIRNVPANPWNVMVVDSFNSDNRYCYYIHALNDRFLSALYAPLIYQDDGIDAPDYLPWIVGEEVSKGTIVHFPWELGVK